MSNLLQKKQAIPSFVHFWWATWAIRSHCSFWWATRGILPHCSLKRKEWENYLFIFKLTKKRTKKRTQVYDFSQVFFERIARFLCQNSKFAIRSKKTGDSLTVTDLSWAIWANCSHSLIWSEWSEQMSEFPTLSFCNTVHTVHCILYIHFCV